MDIYDGRYFEINKTFQQFIGLWPYDPRAKIVKTIALVSVVILMIPNLIGMAIHIHNWDMVMEHLSFILVMMATFMKLFTLGIAEKEMKSVYRSIADNWIMIENEEEKEILMKYSERGRQITIIYTVYLICAALGFITLPVIPLILNRISPLPEQRPSVFIFQSEFLIFDKDVHYVEAYVWDVLSVLAIIIAPIGCDTTYIVVAEHCLALYSIVEHRLLQLKKMVPQNSPDGEDDSCKWMVKIIKLHQVALSFTESIEQSYSTCFFVLAIEHIVVLPLFCVLMVIYFHDNLMTSFRYVLFFNGLLVHLFMIFWPGQKIINHSSILLEHAYTNEWYETAGETKKMLRLFMLKCLKPSLLSAGGLILLNFENYLTIVKTAVSYITVFASFRQN